MNGINNTYYIWDTHTKLYYIPRLESPLQPLIEEYDQWGELELNPGVCCSPPSFHYRMGQCTQFLDNLSCPSYTVGLGFLVAGYFYRSPALGIVGIFLCCVGTCTGTTASLHDRYIEWQKKKICTRVEKWVKENGLDSLERHGAAPLTARILSISSHPPSLNRAAAAAPLLP